MNFRKKKLQITTTIFSVLFFSVLFIFFQKQNKKSELLHKAFEASKNNKEELQLVLDYFSNDALKHKAASFLISNMIHHYSANRTSFNNDNHKRGLDLINSTATEQVFIGLNKQNQKKSIWNKNRTIKKNIDSLVNSIKADKTGFFKKDIENIKADWLINHINKAFDIWNNSKLLTKNNFKEFTETILPYRYGKEQLNTPKDYPEKLWGDLLKDVNLKDSKAVINVFKDYFYRVERLTRGIKNKQDWGFFNYLKWWNLYCDDQVIIASQILNNIGIPTYTDYTPVWLNRPLGHSWCVSKDSLGNYLPFSPFYLSIDSSENKGIYNKKYFSRSSKVFRRTFKIQDESAIKRAKPNEDIPPFFNLHHWKDVSDEYHKTVDVSINIKNFNYKRANLAYLAIFTPRGWMPIDWGIVNPTQKKVKFKKVPVNVVYNVVSFSNFKTKPLNSAFFIDKNGKKHKVEPDSSKTQTIKVIQKYPDKERLLDFRIDRINSKFQGSNDARFKNFDNLYEFTQAPKNYVESIKINVEKKYRYVRFIASNNLPTHISIMEYFRNAKNKEEVKQGSLPYVFSLKDTLDINSKVLKLEGKPISNNKKATLERLSRCFDGDIQTYATDKWVGLDFGKPTKIDEIRYSFRSANNRINVGDLYQLYYYDKGWVYFGIKKAKYNFLELKNVPSGTMYWLKNITKGKEELPFVYHNDKQLFVNYNSINDYFR